MKKAVLVPSVVLILAGTGTGLALGLLSPEGVSERTSNDLLGTLSPFRSYGHVYDSANVEAMRPRLMGSRGVISTGHYLATMAGMDMLKRGGNAFDAGVTAAMALKVTKMDYAGWTGVAPLILYSAAEKQVVTRVGAGKSPAGATLAPAFFLFGHLRQACHRDVHRHDLGVRISLLDAEFFDEQPLALKLDEQRDHFR